MTVHNNIIIIHSSSDYWSNVIGYINKYHKGKKITITDKNDNEVVIPFNDQTVNYPIKIKIWED